MKRREFLTTASAFMASAILPASVGLSTSIKKSRPNIVLIMADDISQEVLGCYGGTTYKTPILDKLAATGTRFIHCYSQPVCAPSRVKIMTGRYNFRNYKNLNKSTSSIVRNSSIDLYCRFYCIKEVKWRIKRHRL